MKWLNYHHLIYFKEIATQGSISAASKLLNVGQPALSSQLKQFENFLGIDLFVRKGRRLVLTDAGRIILDYALKINELRELEEITVNYYMVYTKRIIENTALEILLQQKF
ncbi:MAG: LysR family transcriptional regulator [Bacteriovoracaceae bacterium]|jgi:LysR family transcriptional activator of nhaA|nr:LysR family transcriptional regulator [Bacteriovoracaceae bacterium]